MTLGRSGTDLEIPVAGERLPGYFAHPARGHGRGVLVLHEAFGLVDWIRDVCDRLARRGFVALAPDLYRGRWAESVEDALGLVASLEPERVGRDLEAGVDALLNHDAVDGGRIGAVGFCMGGQLALLAGTRSSRVAAVVDFYGRMPTLPLELEKLEAAVLGIFAENDEFIAREEVEALRKALAKLGKRAAIHVEPGVRHGYMNDARPECFDAVAAAAGWDRMLAFLEAELA